MYAEANSEETRIRALKDNLDHMNFEIHQVSQKIGVELAQFIIGKDELLIPEVDNPFIFIRSALVGMRIPEVRSGEQRVLYRPIAYREALADETGRRALKAVENMYAALEYREKFLDECQYTYHKLFKDDDRVKVDFGLYSIVVTLAIGIIAQYDISLPATSNMIVPLYSSCFDKWHGLLYVRFNWSSMTINEYERFLFYLDWKLNDNKVIEQQQARYHEFRYEYSVFVGWEQQTFPQLFRAP